MPERLFFIGPRLAAQHDRLRIVVRKRVGQPRRAQAVVVGHAGLEHHFLERGYLHVPRGKGELQLGRTVLEPIHDQLGRLLVRASVRVGQMQTKPLTSRNRQRRAIDVRSIVGAGEIQHRVVLGDELRRRHRLVQMAQPRQLGSLHGADVPSVFNDPFGYARILGQHEPCIGPNQSRILEDLHGIRRRLLSGEFHVVAQIALQARDAHAEHRIVEAFGHAQSLRRLRRRAVHHRDFGRQRSGEPGHDQQARAALDRGVPRLDRDVIVPSDHRLGLDFDHPFVDGQNRRRKAGQIGQYRREENERHQMCRPSAHQLPRGNRLSPVVLATVHAGLRDDQLLEIAELADLGRLLLFHGREQLFLEVGVALFDLPGQVQGLSPDAPTDHEQAHRRKDGHAAQHDDGLR